MAAVVDIAYHSISFRGLNSVRRSPVLGLLRGELCNRMLSDDAGLDLSTEIAAQRLSELACEAREVLRAATHDGRTHIRKTLEVSLKRIPLDRIIRRGSVRGGYTIVYGKPVWMLSSSADAVGLNEDGGLGVTEDGELVVTSNWLTVRGEQPIDPNSVKSRRIRSRVASRVRKRGYLRSRSQQRLRPSANPRGNSVFLTRTRNSETPFISMAPGIFYSDPPRARWTRLSGSARSSH